MYVDLPKIFFRKSAVYHKIKLPFDVEVGKIFLNGIYCSPDTVVRNVYSFQDIKT